MREKDREFRLFSIIFDTPTKIDLSELTYILKNNQKGKIIFLECY